MLASCLGIGGTVQSLIGKYPVRGQLDVIKLGQEDEATPDPDGVPWEPARNPDSGDGDARAPEEGCEQVEADDLGEGGGDNDADIGDCLWEDGPCDDEQGEVEHRGHGGGQMVAVGAPAKGGPTGEELTVEQADSLLTHSSRLQSLQQAKGILSSLGGAMGASLTSTVAHVINTESKRFHKRIRGDASVAAVLRTTMEAEEALVKKHRAEHEEDMKRRRDKKRTDNDLTATQAALKKARRDIREAAAVITAKETVKSFSLASFGEGRKNGGGAQFQKARFEALERVRAAAQLSPEQLNDWEYFKTNWDKAMAESHCVNWTKLFAEIVQNVLEELEGGELNAFSDFVHKETKRVLGDIPGLVIPGC